MMTATDIDALRNMTSQDLLNLGIEDTAYVKPIVTEEGKHAYAIHAADGSLMAVVEDRDLAFAAVRQNDLEPVSAH